MKTTTPYRDRSGKTLEDYPRPSVAVDAALLTVSEGALCVLVVQGGRGAQRLPGTFLHPRETLQDATLRALEAKAGVCGRAPRQLFVFDDPNRDDRGWVLSVAHLDVARADTLTLGEGVRLVGVDDLPQLDFDHAEIVRRAAETVRGEYRLRPDPWQLLPEEPDGFTVRDLRLMHEAVEGRRLIPDTFRRAMLPGLGATGALRRGARGKPAELYRRLETAP